MIPRVLLAPLALALACTHPSPQPAPSAHTAVAPDVSPAPPEPPPASRVCAADDDACERSDDALIARALASVANAPDSARETLRGARSRRAVAWRAYLAHHAGDAAAVAEACELLADTSCGGDTPSARAGSTLASVFAFTRAMGDETAAVETFPCAVFDWDLAEAAEVFTLGEGGAEGRIGVGIRSRCVRQLRATAPDATRAPAEAALQRVRELTARFPAPDEGTAWQDTGRESALVLDDLFLLPATPPREPVTVAMLRAIPPGAQRPAERNRRLTESLRVIDDAVPAITAAWRPIAASRGATLDDTAARARVREALLRSLYVWVRAVSSP